jgi:hypothetical protein
MPNGATNFTTPDTSNPSGGYQRRPGDWGDPNRGSGDHGEVWDPNGGPNGQGAWVPHTPSAAPPDRNNFVAGVWGGMGDRIIPGTGKVRFGTNAAAEDVARYRDMGQNPLFANGPAIDRSASDQSGSLQTGALGLLRQRAVGGMTPAQQLAQQQTQGAVNGLSSAAASIKGGAMARAAAARGAVSQGARVGAMGAQDQQALRAREMADAANQYFGGASAQRGQELGLASSQAQLDAAQRGANDQREGFYEGRGFGVQSSDLSAKLNRSAADDAAANASRANALAQAQQDRERAQSYISAGLGAAQGAAGAYLKSTQSNPNDPYSTSDVRSKAEIAPVAGEPTFGGPMAEANRSMAPSSYEYKPEFTPQEQAPGEVNVGPMANAMAEDPVAKTAIVKDPTTGLLAIDKTKGLKLVMGGLADLQRQVDGLEKRKRA